MKTKPFVKKITVQDGTLISDIHGKKPLFRCPFCNMQRDCNHPECDDMDDMTCPIKPKKMAYNDICKVSPECPLRKNDVIITLKA